MMSRRVCFSPEASIYTKHGGGGGGGAAKVGENKKRVMMRIWIFKLSKGSRISVGSFFKNFGEKVAKALPAAAAGRRRCSCKVSSSASLGRSRSYAETLDSHRAEAIEDCIEFLNSSSSSLLRSNSVSSSC